MLALRHQSQWRLTGWALLAAVFALALLPPGWLWPGDVSVSGWLPASDKWAHGVTFAALAIWFSGQYEKRDLVRVAFGLIVFGGVIEVCQGAVGYRSMEFLDFAADAAGVLVGTLLAALRFAGWSVDVESRWQRRAGRESVD